MLKSAPVTQKKEGNRKQETNKRMVGINSYTSIIT